MTKSQHVRVVSLWIHPGQEGAFDAFERDAARIIARHGGRIDSAVRLTPSRAAQDATPYELHIVSFPDEAAADSYANDPETLVLREKRGRIISRTEVMTGQPVGPY